MAVEDVGISARPQENRTTNATASGPPGVEQDQKSNLLAYVAESVICLAYLWRPELVCIWTLQTGRIHYRVRSARFGWESLPGRAPEFC